MNLSRCENIKSRHYPTIRCNSKAFTGGFCKKHCKQPIRFSIVEYGINHREAAGVIQSRWKMYCIRKIFRRQGPAACSNDLANNPVELYSLEPLNTIPKRYFYSFADSAKAIWAFDIRTLSFLCSKSKQIKNPYTREFLSPEILRCINDRIAWLKLHGYSTAYENTSFSLEQIWNNHVLEIFTKMDEVGYIVNTDWFHELTKEEHIDFYKQIHDIWNFRLGLTVKQRNAIVRGYNSRNKLFRFSIDEIGEKDEKSLKKINLTIIEKLVGAGDKTQRALGVMYILMGLCLVNDNVAEAYPWIAASV